MKESAIWARDALWPIKTVTIRPFLAFSRLASSRLIRTDGVCVSKTATPAPVETMRSTQASKPAFSRSVETKDGFSQNEYRSRSSQYARYSGVIAWYSSLLRSKQKASCPCCLRYVAKNPRI
jgi:hypothetical protein